MRPIRPVILLSLLAILLFSGEIAGQAVLHLQPAPAQNRISENANRCMFKDSKGFIWVGTIDGLNRYDGYRFRIYQNDPRDSGSISGNFITCIREDSCHNLWIGTWKGINLYDPLHDGFIRFKTTPDYPENPAGNFITEIIVDSEKQLWMAAYEGGLARFDYQQKRFIRIPVDTSEIPQAIVHTDVTALSNPDKDGFWIGYQNGMISRYADSRFIHYPCVGIKQAIRDLYMDKEGYLWVGSEDGIYRFNPEDGDIMKYHNGLSLDIYEMNKKVWVNVNFDGIYEWNDGEKKLQLVPTYVDGKLVRGDVKAFFKDEQDIIWASYHGLFKQDKYEKRFKWVRFEKGNPNSLSEPFVTGISEDANGNIVVLTIDHGLNYFDLSRKQWLNHKNHSWFDNEVVGVRASRLSVAGSVSFILTPETVYVFDFNQGSLKDFPYPEIGEGINPTLAAVNSNECWIAGSGVFLLNTQTGVFQNFTPVYEPSTGPWFTLFHESPGRIWVTDGNSIFFWDNDLDQFIEQYRVVKSENVYEESVLSFIKDRAGRFWIGRGNGLQCFDPQNRQLKHYTIADGLPSNNINSILTDHHDRLWMGTNNGLSRFDPVTEHFRNYDRYDGIQDEIFLGQAAFKSSSGLLYFGGVNGFNIFHPDSASKTNPYPPKAIISELKIFNKPVVPGVNSVLSKHISDTEELILSYKHSTISFELLALGYSQSDKNQYAYMVEGVDPEWNYTGTNHTASYTGLPRGERLLFKVKAANHDGIWTDNPTVLRIYIRPPVWGTGWFRLSLFVFLLAMILGYYRWRVRQIKQKNVWLEEEIKKHTAELEDQAITLKKVNIELERKTETIREQVHELNQLYKTQSMFFTSLSHEFRTPLTLLLGHLDELVHAEKPELVIHELTNRMQLSAGQILRLVDQIMDSAKLEMGKYRLCVTEGDLVNHLVSIAHSFQIPARKKGLDLHIDIQDRSLRHCWFDPDVIDKVLNNLLSNALKYTDEGLVQITVNKSPSRSMKDQIRCVVEDTGMGISEDLLPYIFNRFYRVEGSPVSRREGTGIGLSLVKQLVELHKGRIKVESEPGKGTRFTIYLPIDASVFTDDEKSGTIVKPVSRMDQRHLVTPRYEHFSTGKRTGGKAKKDVPLIMIVEDNPDIRSFLSRQLYLKYRISESENGDSAWTGIVNQLPDLIISDIIMPGLNGFELCHRVKSDIRTSHIPVILLTALSDQEKKLEGFKHGADAYLSKPFSREELILRISNLIRHREKLRQRFLNEYSLLHMPEGLNDMDKVFLSELNSIIERDLIKDHFGIEELTRMMAVSRTQLFRKLKFLTGMSATEYIRDFRLRKAYQILKVENMTVSEVIHATGFSSRSYFYHSFKKKFGVPPTQLIKNRFKPGFSVKKSR